MARTLYGNLSGRAAVTHLAEIRSEAFEREMDRLEEEKQKKRDALEADMAQAIDELADLDPEGWEAWWDNDKNIPVTGKLSEFTQIVRNRITELKHWKMLREQVDYCQTYISGGDVLEFSSTSASEIPF